jgi:2-polyprenyl-3-methyl-5-hydroxy-6-metoxy-1,4-benzoquinol methylase
MSIFSNIGTIWTGGASDYDKVVKIQLKKEKTINHWKRQLERCLDKEGKLNILDVGCGPGFFSIVLMSLGHQVKSIDGAEGMVSCAKKNIKQNGYSDNVQLEDAVKLSSETEECFDAIVSRDVVWTLYNPKEAFIRWKEVLKPGGRIVIFDGNYHYCEPSLKLTLWRYFSNILIFFSEGRIRHEKKTVLHDLPFCKVKRPEKDCEILKELGFDIIINEKDEFRNKGFYRLKYGYQSKPFIIVAEKRD